VVIGWDRLDCDLHAIQQTFNQFQTATQFLAVASHATMMDFDGQLVVFALQ
jgi:hypothetical protein